MFCTKCGYNLGDAAVCPNCGAANSYASVPAPEESTIMPPDPPEVPIPELTVPIAETDLNIPVTEPVSSFESDFTSLSGIGSISADSEPDNTISVPLSGESSLFTYSTEGSYKISDPKPDPQPAVQQTYQYTATPTAEAPHIYQPHPNEPHPNSNPYYSTMKHQEEQTSPTAPAATGSLVCGIISLVCSLSMYLSLFGIIAAIVGLVFAKKCRTDNGLTGRAKTGRVLSVIGLILGILSLIALVVYIGILVLMALYA